MAKQLALTHRRVLAARRAQSTVEDMEEQRDFAGERDVRELVARFAAQFPDAALTELAGRLLRDQATRSRWDALVGEIVACAVYNKIPLTAAEDLVLRSP